VEQESTASRMLKEIVPLDTRTFVSTLFGNRDPITERNLSPDQLTALREVVQTAEQKGRKGNVQYSDYENDSTYSFTFDKAYPILVSPQPATWADDNFHRLTVSFTYIRWYRKNLDRIQPVDGMTSEERLNLDLT
jgi:hypothetical protein